MRPRRPGPARIPPNQQPGGKVVHVYNDQGRLVLVRQYLDAHDAAQRAENDARRIVELLGDRKVAVIVEYDGTTGNRERNGDPT